MSNAWYESRFTGLFREFQHITPRPHDPEVYVCAASAPQWHAQPNTELHPGGCGCSYEDAVNGCVGEGLERLFAYPAPQDFLIESSYEDWPLDEPAIDSERWVLFHPEQYALERFPFEPLTRQTQCRWVCFRDVASGEPRWIPEDFAFLLPRSGSCHRFCPAISTGLAAGTVGQPVVLRALQEVIERDALLGAWWNAYSVEEFPREAVWESEDMRRFQRPNLRWRFFRIQSPFSEHVTMVTVEGEDREGFCHSIGSACRETLRDSWMKATLEAVQGRHYVRYLRSQHATKALRTPLESFAEHAVYYSFRPEELERTVLNRPRSALRGQETCDESLPLLCERLEQMSTVLVRNLTPPALFENGLDWRVVKVVVPGLQPLHGDDRFAHLGGKLWSPRAFKEWSRTPPHPFP